MAGPVVALLAPQPGERILDLGCGDGALAAQLVAAGARVVGVDSAPEMVTAARQRGIDAHLVNGEALTFLAEFDAVFSNAALHWMQRPVAVIEGVRQALRPGGRFVAELGGEGNIATIVAALSAALTARGVEPSSALPWYFPSSATYRALLEAAGFAVSEIALHRRPTPVAAGATGWLDTFAGGIFAVLPEGERATARAEVIACIAPSRPASEGPWMADYVRLRFRAVLPDAAASPS
ncbi:MAG: class I SAM-dependent methyltransferase [Alphaproteobacteria bacterium]|nr:class I SAM-dependent methyltransferase [Alphaproteobacteria bacterium]